MTTSDEVLDILKSVKDPEVPVLDIVEMGIVRNVEVDGDRIRVAITPTYSGCPALHAIQEAILQALAKAGLHRPEIRIVYAPAWTTDAWSEETREKLRAYGIAPPERSAGGASPLPFSVTPGSVRCPYCDSTDTEQKSAFGSTPCKALHFCHACRQPFEHFKCH